MRKNCDTCLHDEFGEKYCNDCYCASGKQPTKWEPSPFWTPDTNADRIRAMSDEELVRFIEDTQIAGCPYPAMSCRQSCKECIMNWLHQPAGEE